MEITFRPITAGDLLFLKQVYRSTREEEMNLTDWDDEKKSGFIDQQFNAQHDYYQQVYNDARFDIILIDGEQAGRLYLWESNHQIRIVDISFLPGFRNRGAGTHIFEELIDKSENTGKILSIHVEYYNRALRFYNRLGFKTKDQTGVYYYMEREPLDSFKKENSSQN